MTCRRLRHRRKLQCLRDWKVKEIPPASVEDELSFDHPLY